VDDALVYLKVPSGGNPLGQARTGGCSVWAKKTEMGMFQKAVRRFASPKFRRSSSPELAGDDQWASISLPDGWVAD
jgi:hypothetical protein